MYNLSIIIPHYNSLETLEKLLSSIPKIDQIQTIVIDDNSSEEVKKNIDTFFKEKFDNVLFLRNNSGIKGAGKCRNIGLEAAKGEWVIFADSDDYFLEDFYSIIKKYIKSCSDVIYYTPTSVEAETGEISDRHLLYKRIIENYKTNQNMNNENVLKYKFFVPWSKLIKRNFIKKNNLLFDEVIASNDIMFSAKLGFYLKNFEISEEIIYCVTKRNGSLTNQMTENVFNSRMKVFIDYYVFLKERLSKNEFKELELSGRHILMDVIKYNLGLRKFIGTYFCLQKNMINLFSFKLMNPVFLIKKVYKQYSRYQNDKKYYTN